MYLTYAQYQTYGGTLDETTFEDFEFEAESIINWFTFDRLKDEEEWPEAVMRCMYKLINIAKIKADAMQLGMQTTTTEVTTESGTTSTMVSTTPTIQSQSNDGVSVSYNVLSASELFNALQARTKGGEIDQIVQRYLQDVKNSLGRKVLYRGLYPGE